MKKFTVKDALNKLNKLPQDAVLCNEIEGEYFSFEGILEYNRKYYINGVGEEIKDNIVVLK